MAFPKLFVKLKGYNTKDPQKLQYSTIHINYSAA